MNRAHGFLSLLGAAGAAVLPFINVPGVVGTAAHAVTAAHPLAAPLVSVALAAVAQHAPSIFGAPSQDKQ